EVFSEGGGLHVVRIAAKTSVLPAGVDGILAGVPESSEPRQMQVPDAVLLQGNRELILSELRIAAGLRDRAHIDKLMNTVRFEHFEKFLDGKRGMADGEDHIACISVLSFESNSSITEPGREQIIVAFLARQSRLFTWSDRIAPWTFEPAGI